MKSYIPVAGTHAKKKNQWTTRDSSFNQYMQKHGYYQNTDRFKFWSHAFGMFNDGHRIWQYGASRLAPFLLSLPEEDRLLITHSYGGAVGAYALAEIAMEGQKIRALIDIDCPLRRDLDEIWEQARPAIPLHIHLYSTGWGSRIRFFGQRLRFMRKAKWADYNISVKGGHSGVVREAKYIPQIQEALDLVD